MRLTRLGLIFGFICTTTFAQSLVVTAEGRRDTAPPDIAKDDVSAQLDRHPESVAEWMPLRTNQAKLELYIVIDDGADTNLGLQFPALKSFMSEQPETTRIGLAYLRNGAAIIASPLTNDRAAPEKALRIPLGSPGISASPYMGISDLIKKWPAVDARREVLLIASGIDPWSPPDPQNPYLMSAITDAQRAGILIHSIYFSEAGHLGHSYSGINWGQNYLSELGDQTGGEAYWQGYGSPVSFEPFLKDLRERFEHQYLLTISAEGLKSGLIPFRVAASVPGVSLVSASKINIRK